MRVIQAGIIAAPTVLEGVPVQFKCGNDVNYCEDCPDINLNPPPDSECQYFEVHAGVPVCTKEGSLYRQLEEPAGRIGTDSVVNIVPVIE